MRWTAQMRLYTVPRIGAGQLPSPFATPPRRSGPDRESRSPIADLGSGLPRVAATSRKARYRQRYAEQADGGGFGDADKPANLAGAYGRGMDIEVRSAAQEPGFERRVRAGDS